MDVAKHTDSTVMWAYDARP